MIITQQIEHIREDRYRNEITITDIPQGYFPAIISNTADAEQPNRKIAITLMPLEQSAGGTMNCNTGRFQRREQETGIQVSLSRDGEELMSSYVSYDHPIKEE